ncbi:PAS domain-containing protein [Desulfosporosinus burensis]
MDIDGTILEVNKAWLDLLGYSRHEVIGKWIQKKWHWLRISNML